MSDPKSPTTGRMTPAERRGWNRIGGIAECDSQDDMFCQGLETRGLVTCYDCMFGHNYYTPTVPADIEWNKRLEHARNGR